MWHMAEWRRAKIINNSIRALWLQEGQDIDSGNLFKVILEGFIIVQSNN